MGKKETIRTVKPDYRYEAEEHYAITFARAARTEEEALQDLATEMSIPGWRERRGRPKLFQTQAEQFDHPEHFVHDVVFVTDRGGMWWGKLGPKYVLSKYPEALLICVHIYDRPFKCIKGLTLCSGKIVRYEARRIERPGHSWSKEKENWEALGESDDDDLELI